jgi:ACDE family multidrug resistance protein
LNKVLLGIFLVTPLSMLGVFNIAPALPYIASALSLSETDISYLLAAFTLGNVLVAPFAGLIADTVGRRVVLLPSLYLFGIAGVACGLVDDFGWLLFWRFVQGIGSAALGSLSVTMISDMFSGPERVRYFGYNMALNSVGMIILPLLGGILVTYSWRYPFLLMGIALPIALYNQFFLHYNEPRHPTSPAQYFRQLFISMRDVRLVRASYLNFSVFVLFGGAFITYYSLLFVQRFPDQVTVFGFNCRLEVIIGLAMSLFSIMVGIISARLGAIHQRFGFREVLTFSFIVYGAGLFLFQLSTTIIACLASAMLLGVAHGLAVPSIVALHTRLAPPGMTAAYVVLNSLVFRIGQTLGPLMMAVILSHSDLSMVFIVAACLSIPSAWLAWKTNWRGEVPAK